MSTRSVEGHLFRASQRVGANSREQLISILRGWATVPGRRVPDDVELRDAWSPLHLPEFIHRLGELVVVRQREKVERVFDRA
ncbi:MAG: hypothetical protein QOF31_2953 [Mycobacterium sp.]|jgi:hypothetical protein|nr:hypothetical protein [Mycobacterium sp.]